MARIRPGVHAEVTLAKLPCTEVYGFIDTDLSRKYLKYIKIMNVF